MLASRSSIAFAVVTAAAMFVWNSIPAPAQDAVARGKYLVGFGGCNDCHTPGYFFGKPEMARYLGGSEVGFEIPGLGVFHGPNLTPDPETGLGNVDGRGDLPSHSDRRAAGRARSSRRSCRGRRSRRADQRPTPWRIASLISRACRPVKNKVPGPFGPTETADIVRDEDRAARRNKRAAQVTAACRRASGVPRKNSSAVIGCLPARCSSRMRTAPSPQAIVSAIVEHGAGRAAPSPRVRAQHLDAHRRAVARDLEPGAGKRRQPADMVVHRAPRPRPVDARSRALSILARVGDARPPAAA